MQLINQDVSQVERDFPGPASYFPTEQDLLNNAQVLREADDVRLSRSLLIRGLQFYPNSFKLLKALAEVAEKLGDQPLALKCYQAMIKTDHSTEILLKCVSLMQSFNQHVEARDLLIKSLSEGQVETNYLFEVFKEIGNICVKNNDLDWAEEYYNKAFAVHPNSPQLLVNYGTLELQRNNYETALQRFRHALEQDPTYANAWIGLAFIHRSYGDIELSIANMTCALDHDPNNRTALRLFAEWSLALGRLEPVASRLESFLMSTPQDFEFSLLFARINTILGRYPIAWAAAQMAVAVDPSSIEAQEVLEEIKSRIRKAGN